MPESTDRIPFRSDRYGGRPRIRGMRIRVTDVPELACHGDCLLKNDSRKCLTSSMTTYNGADQIRGDAMKVLIGHYSW